MKPTVLFILSVMVILIFLGPARSGRQGRHGPFYRCVECRNACRASSDRKSCERTCFQLKAADCRGSGYGPGPARTCDCT